MQHLTKAILTTKIAKATKGLDIFDYKLRALRVLRGQIRFSRLALFLIAVCRTGSAAIEA
jgi:hypothetical protein